ncbi:MAG: hypothetical protein Q9P14_05670 [candidate division KSB1 bacterium]|nr:hypothetical protein [candidate division KSB1 bacterium]
MSTGKLRPQNVLLLRTDRIGDVILSTPVALALIKAHPDSQITFPVRRATLPIVQSCPAVDAAIPIEMFTGRSAAAPGAGALSQTATV